MNLLKRKTVACKLCSKKVQERKIWKVKMNTADGQSVIRICPECADILDSAKDNINSWLTEK